ncbi:MAG: hypothetical protein ACRCZB_00800 [Bacteroidales bacterium]
MFFFGIKKQKEEHVKLNYILQSIKDSVQKVKTEVKKADTLIVVPKEESLVTIEESKGLEESVIPTDKKEKKTSSSKNEKKNTPQKKVEIKKSIEKKLILPISKKQITEEVKGKKKEASRPKKLAKQQIDNASALKAGTKQIHMQSTPVQQQSSSKSLPTQEAKPDLVKAEKSVQKPVSIPAKSKAKTSPARIQNLDDNVGGLEIEEDEEVSSERKAKPYRQESIL